MPRKSETPFVPFKISVAKEHLDYFRMLAADMNKRNPDEVTSASYLARIVLLKFVEDNPLEQ